MVISAATNSGVKELLDKTSTMLAELKKDVQEDEAPILVLPPDEAAADHGDSGAFEIFKNKDDVFTVVGDRVERLVGVTNMKDPESLFHLHHLLRVMGIIEALIQQGAMQGTEVHIGEMSFTFGEEWS